jgi:glycosyltransferase involved in cell wall biosynthesis
LPTFSRLDPQLNGEALLQERPYFLYLGRITTSKGIVILLEEFAELGNYDLLVVGDGDLLPTLQAKYAGYPHIQFLGSLPLEQLGSLYRHAIALVLPSLAPEVFPLNVLEAFAHGTPAIVHNAGGSREAVDKTGGGLVYDSRQELQHALALLATDLQLRETLGQRARVGYTQFYTQAIYVSQYLNLVNDIVMKKDGALIEQPGNVPG